ncbi:MAG: hypothetical protein CL790_06525 [Chloroflexi bacterium]|nr:hypothetical protein [Chloroflexota bacterium]HCU73234.1 hypothetical protein [Chloroflexota bacterium]
MTPTKRFSGSGNSVYQAYVARQRRSLKVERSLLAQAQVRVLEAWFCCLTFSDEPGFEPDLHDARAELRDAEAELDAVEARVTRAEARLEKFERRLLSLTTGPPEA